MRLPFWKMHGAGNDFILVDNRSGNLGSPDVALVRKLCARRSGIGADGLILIQSSATADFGFAFFNADGSRAAMCGNGARCAARLAHDIGAAQREMVMQTDAGNVYAEVTPDAVRIRVPPPSDWRLNNSLELNGDRLNYHFVNTGVPHAVIEVEDLETVDVQGIGAGVRSHSAFGPEGVNVDFMLIRGPNELHVRTYERGVEAETPACGTGVLACGLVAGRLGKATPPVNITCASGDKLEVAYRLSEDTAPGDVTLLGPARHVFHGEFDSHRL